MSHTPTIGTMEYDRIKTSILEGEMILKSGKCHGRKMSKDELWSVKNSVDNARKKIGEL